MEKTLAEILAEMPDFRQKGSVDYKLTDVLMISILAALCGAGTYKRIEAFAQSKKEWLEGFLELPSGIPSSYTIRRIMMNINQKQFHTAFIEWVQILSKNMNEIEAIENKNLHRTKSMKDGKKALHAVNVFVKKNRAFFDVPSKEDTAEIPEFLKLLKEKGCIIKIDAND